MRFLADTFFLLLFFVLLMIWAVAWATLHVAGGLVHLLLVLAAISLVMHLVRGRSAA